MSDIEINIPLIGQTPLFEGFTQEEIREVISLLDGCIVQFNKGDCISNLIDRRYPHTFACILSGGAMLTSCDAQGTQAILDFVVPGCILGYYGVLTNANYGDIHITTTSPSLLLCLGVEPLLSTDSVSRYPLLIKLNKNIMRLLAEHSWRLLEKSDIIFRHSLRERVLSFLNVQRKFFRSDTFEIPLNRQQLADYLYINRSALSRELGNLRKEGFLDFHKSRFTLRFPPE